MSSDPKCADEGYGRGVRGEFEKLQEDVERTMRRVAAIEKDLMVRHSYQLPEEATPAPVNPSAHPVVVCKCGTCTEFRKKAQQWDEAMTGKHPRYRLIEKKGVEVLNSRAYQLLWADAESWRNLTIKRQMIIDREEWERIQKEAQCWRNLMGAPGLVFKENVR